MAIQSPELQFQLLVVYWIQVHSGSFPRFSSQFSVTSRSTQANQFIKKSLFSFIALKVLMHGQLAHCFKICGRMEMARNLWVDQPSHTWLESKENRSPQSPLSVTSYMFTASQYHHLFSGDQVFSIQETLIWKVSRDQYTIYHSVGFFLSLFHIGMHMWCVCVCKPVGALVYIHVDLKLALNVFLYHTPLYLLRQALLLNPSLPIPTVLASQLVQSPECWD